MRITAICFPISAGITETLRVMRLITIFITILCVQVSAKSVSQEITFTGKDVPLRNVFASVKAQTGYVFFLSKEVLARAKPVTVSVSKVPLRNFLEMIFKEQPLEYVIKNSNILVKVKRQAIIQHTEVDGLTDSFPPINIQGRVVDENGNPVEAVTVSVKGSELATSTNASGEFLLSGVDKNATLVLTSTNVETREVKVDGKNELSIQVKTKVNKMDEIIVVGYGTTKKSDLTGSIASLKADDLNQAGVSSVDQGMLGRVAGVQISQASSEPGGGLSIRIRGASSINAGNEPLYVIDGLPIDNSSMLDLGGAAAIGTNLTPRNPLSALNPNDVKSIEILKDASATAIYGSRGANGVVLITTKMGTQGKVKVNYDLYTGMQKIAKKMDILSATEYINALNAISADKGEAPAFTPEQISEIGKGTDWQDEIFQTAPINNHNLSVSGGAMNTKYFFSGNYYDQQGIIVNTGMKKYSVRLNLEQQLGKRLTLSVNLTNSLVKDDVGANGISDNEFSGSVYSALLFDPTLAIKNPDGTFQRSNELLLNNPASIVQGIQNKIETNRMFGNIAANLRITDDLSTKLNVGSDRQFGRADVYNSRHTLQGFTNNGLANIRQLERSNIMAEYTITYKKKFNDNHNLTALGGVTYQDFISRSFSSSISDFPTDILGTDNLGFGNAQNALVGSFKEGYTLLSYLSRINYTLFDKFLFTGSIRADGSSRFGENSKYGYFPSFAFAWKMMEEEFVPDLFTELKFRSSWGVTGNQSIANYASLATFNSAGFAIFDESVYRGSDPARVANPSLKWESTEQFNIGIDAAILNGRISGTFDYFLKNTRDMLISLPLPLSSGFTSVLTNIGEMRNTGVEALVTSRNLISPNFKWNTTIVFSAIKNRVLDIGGLNSILLGPIARSGNSTIISPGLPLNSYYGYNVLGIFRTEDEIAKSAQPTAKPGYPIFEDLNNDQKINASDMKTLGSPFPDFTFGFRNTFIYKNFELDIFFQGQQGNELLNGNAIEFLYPSNFRRNRSRQQISDRWTPQNPDAKWPSATEPTAYGGGKINSLVVEDASYIRLKTLQLSYNIPFFSNKLVKNARVYLNAQNLITWTNYSGFDPEANVYGDSNVHIDYNAYPLARIIMLGLNLNF